MLVEFEYGKIVFWITSNHIGNYIYKDTKAFHVLFLLNKTIHRNCASWSLGHNVRHMKHKCNSDVYGSIYKKYFLFWKQIDHVVSFVIFGEYWMNLNWNQSDWRRLVTAQNSWAKVVIYKRETAHTLFELVSSFKLHGFQYQKSLFDQIWTIQLSYFYILTDIYSIGT